MIIVCSRDAFQKSVPKKLRDQKFFTTISVSDSSHTNVSSDKYIIIAVLANNSDASHKKPGYCWSKEFVDNLNSTLTCNMKGSGEKHHGSYGEYRGVGIINKYAKDEDQLSFGEFASNSNGT